MSGKGVMAWEDFQKELLERQDDIRNMLPANVKVERFISAAVAAVKHNPDLLFADKRSLFNALTKAAQDGLLPDGREAHIGIYNTNVAPKGEKEVWVKMAQYNPMVHGIRKRAMELADIIIDAQVVYKNDFFKRTQGDDPKIIHEPAEFDVERGDMIGCYAIFKEKDGPILHRESMSKTEVMAVKEQSKAKFSLMWTKFETEGWRKSVIRRGIKTVPVSEDFERIVRRDDEHFDFSNSAKTEAVAAIVAPPAPTDDPPAIEHKEAGQTIPEAKTKETVAAQGSDASTEKKTRPRKKAPAATATIDADPRPEPGEQQGEASGDEFGLPPTDAEEQEYQNFRLEMMNKVDGCETEDDITALRAGVLPQLKNPVDRKVFQNACADKSTEIWEEKNKG